MANASVFWITQNYTSKHRDGSVNENVVEFKIESTKALPKQFEDDLYLLVLTHLSVDNFNLKEFVESKS